VAFLSCGDLKVAFLNPEFRKVAFLNLGDLKVAFLNLGVHEGGLPEPGGRRRRWRRVGSPARLAQRVGANTESGSYAVRMRWRRVVLPR
jgi:hypothetical protein